MIYADTDGAGVRTYRLPQALADVAMELFPGMEQCAAVFRLAKSLSWHDVHTVERIALNGTQADAVEFARSRIEKLVLATRRIH